MAVLTKEELVLLNPDPVYRMPFVLNYELWPNVDRTLSTILNNPQKILFDSTIRKKLGTLKNAKGIYMFIIEPEFPFVPSVNYLVYVGRVINDNTFFKRFYEYVDSIGNVNARRNVQLLTNLWPGKTWVYFYELTLADKRIAEIEDNIFNNICPPLNNKFRSKRALNSRSIYN